MAYPSLLADPLMGSPGSLPLRPFPTIHFATFEAQNVIECSPTRRTGPDHTSQEPLAEADQMEEFSRILLCRWANYPPRQPNSRRIRTSPRKASGARRETRPTLYGKGCGCISCLLPLACRLPVENRFQCSLPTAGRKHTIQTGSTEEVERPSPTSRQKE